MPRGAVRVALVLALLLTAAGGTATAGSAQAAPDGDGSVAFDVQLLADGDAVWTVSTTVRLENESDREAFRELAESFERGEDVGFSAAVFRRAADAASRATGRPMTVRDVGHNATIVPGEEGASTGRLALRFRWTNFARVEGDRLHVGDAFNTTNGTWLPGLAPGQTLVIRPPPDHNVVSAPIGPRAGVLRWEGPVTFEPGALSITYEQSGLGLPTELLAGAGALAAAIVVVALLWTRRGRVRLPTGAETNGGESAAVDVPSTPDEGDGPAAGETVVEEALLSDEERVEQLLEANGGRMKQARIVKETGWSNAKVSQLLSAMDEDDRVDKLRIGRENLISLPDEDVGRIE